MNSKFGMGLTETPSSITTSLPFFMTMDLPYSIYRNEILIVDVNFFNNINQDQDFVISIEKNGKFKELPGKTAEKKIKFKIYNLKSLNKILSNTKKKSFLTFLLSFKIIKQKVINFPKFLVH